MKRRGAQPRAFRGLDSGAFNLGRYRAVSSNHPSSVSGVAYGLTVSANLRKNGPARPHRDRQCDKKYERKERRRSPERWYPIVPGVAESLQPGAPAGQLYRIRSAHVSGQKNKRSPPRNLHRHPIAATLRLISAGAAPGYSEDGDSELSNAAHERHSRQRRATRAVACRTGTLHQRKPQVGQNLMILRSAQPDQSPVRS